MPQTTTGDQIRRTHRRTRIAAALRPLIAQIPPAIGNPLADRAGDLIFIFARKSRRYAADNIRHVLGKSAPQKRIERATRGIFRNVMRNYYDLFRAPQFNKRYVERMVDYDEVGWARLVELNSQKRGALMVTAHFGSFDIFTHVVLTRGVPVLSLMARIKPVWLSDLVIRLRTEGGLDFVLVDDEEEGGSNLTALRQAIKWLREGHILGVIADRNTEPQGVSITFFGEETVVAAGTAKLALRTNAAIVPTFCYRLPKNRYSITFEEPIPPVGSANNPEDVKALTQKLFARFEHHISRQPQQWVLLQRVWK